MAVENGRWVSLGAGIMIMELILVHSGVMMASPMSEEVQGKGFLLGRTWKISKKQSMIIMLVFYAVFGGAILFSFKSVDLFLTFSGILISRWAGLLIDSDTARDQQFNRSLLSLLLFVIAVVLALAVKFPAGGLTPEVLNRVGAGAFEKQALIAGVIYFGLSGLVEATGTFWQRPKVRRIVLNILGVTILIVFIGAFGTMFFLILRSVFVVFSHH